MSISMQEVSAKARADADAWKKDDALARARGSSAEQIAARQRVVKMFCEIHFPKDTPEIREGKLAQVDYTVPTTTLNGRNVDLDNPKSKGFLGIGRKPAYFVSEAIPPQKPEEPIYVLEYFPVN